MYVDNWSEDDLSCTESMSSDKPESGEGHPKEDSRASSLVTWIIGFIIIFQARHVISDSAIEALLKFLCILMKILGQFSDFLRDMAWQERYHRLFICCLKQLRTE